MDKEKETMKEVFNEEAPQAPEFKLDQDNPLKWGDEVEQKIPEFEIPSGEEPADEEPKMSFEADPEKSQQASGWENQNKYGAGWNDGGAQQASGWEAEHNQQYQQNQQYQYNPQYNQQYGQNYNQPYGQQTYGQPYGQPMGPIGEKNKLVAGLLAIFLGALGIHKFYMGMNQQGIIMLVGSLAGSLLCGLGPIVMGIIALIEGIIYLTQTDQQFYDMYEVGRKPWF